MINTIRHYIYKIMATKRRLNKLEKVCHNHPACTNCPMLTKRVLAGEKCKFSIIFDILEEKE